MPNSQRLLTIYLLTTHATGVNADASTMNSFREQLKAGLCEDIMIDIDLPPKPEKNDNKAGGPIGIAFDTNSGTFTPNDLFGKLKVGFNGAGKKRDIKRMKVSDARWVFTLFCIYCLFSRMEGSPLKTVLRYFNCTC